MEAVEPQARPAQSEVDESRRAHRQDVLLAAVLSVAALATAWCAYQATLWGGEMARDFNRGGALRSDAMRLSLESGQLTLADVTIATEWLSAELNGNQALAGELRSRMSPELDAAMDDWLGDWKQGDAIPSGGPFQPGRYVARGSETVLEREQQAEAFLVRGREANRHADNYVLTGVLFALVLVFVGLSSRVANATVASRMVYGTATLAVLGVLLLLLQPQRFSI
ncbi:MAG TPA: hypothetical protein VIB47_10810 [Dehalococcoidia bacterium]|jgi:hypothetical protein